MILERFDGPACPRCGCCDTRVSQEPQVVAAARPDAPGWPVPGVAKCGHCGYRFSFQAEKEEPERPVYAPKAKCPTCGKRDTYVASSPKPEGAIRVRYHKCNRCQTNFKTTGEADEDEPVSVKMSA